MKNLYNDNKGIALIITLLVLTLLVTLILDFNSSMRVEARNAANFRDTIRAYYLAKSGITFARTVLEEDGKTGYKYDGPDELWAQHIPPIPVGDGFVTVKITDEDSKINVNRLLKGFGMVSKTAMREWMIRFLEHMDVSSEIVDPIIDWLDKDDRELLNGAESAYYEGLEDPYEAKNNLMDSIDELRLIKGIDKEIFNRIHPFLTVYSDGWININTAGKDVLLSLSDNMTEDMVDEIETYRKENSFKKKVDLKNNTSMDEDLYNEISKFIDVRTNYFSIKSTGEVNGIKKTINAIIKRHRDKTVIVYWHVD